MWFSLVLTTCNQNIINWCLTLLHSDQYHLINDPHISCYGERMHQLSQSKKIKRHKLFGGVAQQHTPHHSEISIRPSVSFVLNAALLKVFVSVIKTKVDNRWRSRSARLFFVIDCSVSAYCVHSFDCFSLFVKGKFISVTRSWFLSHEK